MVTYTVPHTLDFKKSYAVNKHATTKELTYERGRRFNNI